MVEVLPVRFDTVDRASEAAFNNAASGCLMAGPRALAFALSLLFRPLRGLGGGSRPHPQRLDPVQVPVTAFRVQLDDRRIVQCSLRGELRGGAIHLGDRVEVRGRLGRRTRVIEVSEIVDHTTGARTRGHVARGARNPGLRGALRLLAVLLFLYALLVIIF